MEKTLPVDQPRIHRRNRRGPQLPGVTGFWLERFPSAPLRVCPTKHSMYQNLAQNEESAIQLPNAITNLSYKYSFL